MRRRFLFIATTLVIAMLCGCTSALKEEQLGQGEIKEMDLTKEYIIANSELTEKDFENVDFDAFVKEYELTISDLGEYNIKSLLELYKRSCEKEEATDYTYIYDKSNGKLEENDVEQITLMVWEYHEGNNNSCMVVDFDKKIIYYDKTYFLDGCSEQISSYPLKEDDVESIKKDIYTSKIFEWENEYVGTNEGTTESFSWAIGFELADSRCVKYSGRGVLNSNTPKEMNVLIKSLIKQVTD